MIKRIFGILLAFFMIKSVGHAQIVATGTSNSFFICADSTVMACGYNNHGQLGDGTTTTRLTAVHVSGLTGIIAVSSGATHTLFLKSDGSVWACGANVDGRLGTGGASVDRLTPILTSMTNVKSISAGDNYSIFLKNDSTAWVCGDNSSAQLGNGTVVDLLVPQMVAMSGIIGVAGGFGHSFFIKSDSTVWGCGYNFDGALGDGTTINRSVPVQVIGLTGVKAVAAAIDHSLFLKGNGTVWACGKNGFGQLGNGTTSVTAISTPFQVPSLSGIIRIEACYLYSLFLKNNGAPYGCGKNDALQLGISVPPALSPILLSLTGVTDISGHEHSIFARNDGNNFTCGNNPHGGLGNGTTLVNPAPDIVIGLCSNSPAKVWPGDTDNDFEVDNTDLLPIGLWYGQTGPARTVMGNVWQADSALDWGALQINNKDIKHADCNGDGVINSSDTLAVNLNFNSAHTFAPESEEYRGLTPPLKFASTSTSYLAGDWIDIDITAGISTNKAFDLYGIAYSFQYNSSVVQPGTESFSFPAGWFASPGTDAIKMAMIDVPTSKVYLAETRTDHTNRDGFGTIGTFRFQASTSVATPTNMSFNFLSCTANDSAGLNKPFGLFNYTVTINPLSTGTTTTANLDWFEVYPNPNNGNFNIMFASQEKSNYKLELRNVLGQVVYQETLPDFIGTYSKPISVSNYGKGVYTITLTNDKQDVIKKIIVY